MKIVWLVNIPLPEFSMLLNEKPQPFGGWLVNASKELSKQKDIELYIISPRLQKEHLIEIKGNKINYITFSTNSKNLESLFFDIINKISPDLVHIFGTEFKHTLQMSKMCSRKGVKYVISIQGLVSFIAQHYTTGLPVSLLKKYTFRDILKNENILKQQRKLILAGKHEIQALKMAENVIGRTTWDRAGVNHINSQAKYFNCNETLRTSFYNNTWEYEKCDKYTIFVSQGAYPIKGLHFILEAVNILKMNYDVKLYIGGINICKDDSLKDRLKISSYGKYIKKLIKDYDLSSNVHFIGLLEEEEICKTYLKSHVFVCPSIIENSPNSLGEAMLLGVPTVASYVGGIPDLLENNKEGILYQANEPHMLANSIEEIFKDNSKAQKFSRAAQEKARIIYDVENNCKRLIEIYTTILSNK